MYKGPNPDNINPEISVIIPVYNVAPYIREAAESLFKQTLANIEYIFIDDNSKDESLEILKEVIERFPERKPFVRIIRHKENKGVSFTREEGVRLARGNWLIHCDSDDVVEPDIYSKLLEAATNNQAQIAICSFNVYGEKTKPRTHGQGKGLLSSQEMVERMTGLKLPLLHGSLCNKLISRELWEGIEFDRDISFCEDEMVLYKILLTKPQFKIAIITESLYHYRIRTTSLVRTLDNIRRKEIKLLISKIENLREKDKTGEYREALNSKIIRLLHFYLQFQPSIKEFCSEYQAYLKNIEANKTLNYFEKLHLRLCLKGDVILGQTVGFCNKWAKRIIKKIRK